MTWKGHFKNALIALALASLNAPQAEAIEIFTGTGPATHVNDGLITEVRGGRGGGMHHRGGGHRGGMHHGGMHRGGAAGYTGAVRMAGCTGPAERTAATSTETSIAMLTETSTATSIGRDTAIAVDTAIAAAQPGPAVPAGTAGQRAALSRPAPRSASSRRLAPRPGRARRRKRDSAGITPTRANARASGTPARSGRV